MNFFRFIFLFFLIIPFLEIYLLLRIGATVGAVQTILLVVLTAIIGVYLLRAQGFSTWQKVQTSLARGEIPAIEMVEGLILLIGGALLLTPGFFTDAIGFLCLIPHTRKRLALTLIKNQFVTNIDNTAHQRTHQDQSTIEGKFKKDD